MAAARSSAAALLAALALAALPLAAIAARSVRTTNPVTPIQKVIELLENIEDEVKVEGLKEGESYSAFSCFCQSKTNEISSSILSGRDNINTESATLGEKTAEKADKLALHFEKEKKAEELSSTRNKEKARCAKLDADYASANADLSKAINSVVDATQAVKDSKVAPSMLAERQSVKQSLVSVKKSIELAEAMKIISEGPKWGGAGAFLQASVDPLDPEYKFHSEPLLHLLSELEAMYKKKKADADEEYAREKQSCDDSIRELGEKITANENAIEDLQREIAALTRLIAETRGKLVRAQYDMQEDVLYMTDLTALCQQRAADWDQRTQLRSDELTALEEALGILRGKVTAATAVNERALLQLQHPAPPAAVVPAGVGRSGQSLSLLQDGMAGARREAHGAAGRLAGGEAAGSAGATAQEQRRGRALELLRREGGRLGSVAISSLAARAGEDPFLKVKTLIQRLIERLLDEATSEATKKGFCDEELGKERKNRQYRWEETLTLNSEVQGLEAKKLELETEIADLKEAAGAIVQSIQEATEDRNAEKGDNLETIRIAKEGLGAVTEALNILKVFYKEAVKAKVLVQTEASPVDQDAPPAGFEGAYKGKQAASKGIIGLLEVIQSDFSRTVRVTTQAEEDAAAAYVKFKRSASADLSGKDKKIQLDEEDLATTKDTIQAKMGEMQNNMDLVDKALQALDKLKPMCIDTGMAYSERTEKRDREVEALKKAMCILEPDAKDMVLCQQWGY